MKTRIVIAILTLSIITACFGLDWNSELEDDSLAAKIERNLTQIGDKAAVFESLYSAAESEIRPGVAFMLANEPPVNLIAHNPDAFLEEIRLAYEAKNSFPWGRKISDELFYHYVLPNQVSQEQLTYYREYLMDALREVLDTGETGEEAAVAVNYWCGERVRFEQTQRQDQGVFHTLASGYGRCEEMMIVYVSALRAVGIPAREAWTPYWATGDNNHAWTELYAGGEWHFAGSCEPKPTLDNAWFNKTARRAAVIMSAAYGVPETDEILYREREHYAIINSTPHYIEKPAKLRVEVGSDSCDVYLAVFNFGALRPIMRLNTGDSTAVTFTMGRGDYVLYAGDEGSFASAVAHTEFGETTEIELIPEEGGKLAAENFWLRYPVPE